MRAFDRLKNTLPFLVALVLTTTAEAQTTPINFVRSWEALSPQTDPAAMAGKPLNEVRQTTQYLDGLGRPLQTVVRQGSLNTAAHQTAAVDLVSLVVYDAFGREATKYLPFAAHTNSGGTALANDGSYKATALAQQSWFYSNSNPLSPINGQGDTKYYAQTNYEASPLNRVDKVLPPGESWVGASRGVSSQRFFNTAVDSVRIWTVTEEAGFGKLGSYSSPGMYGAGKLYKNSTTDEAGGQVLEFTDLEGKVVLKKVQQNKTEIGWMLSIEKTRTDTVIKDIPLKRNGKLPTYYLNKPNVERHLGLNTLENGFDSIQIRIWYGYAFIDTSQLVILKNNKKEWVAELVTFKYHTDNRIDSVNAIDKTSVKSQPKSGWSNFINKLFSLKITELPDFSKVKNYQDMMDGDDVIVEISTVNSYRIFSYKEPRHFKERIPEAKSMEMILELVEDEFGFLRLRKL